MYLPAYYYLKICSHQMSIIFSEEHLKDINPPCVAQSFINHGAILYKILVVGCKQFIIQRPSLKNLYPGSECNDLCWTHNLHLSTIYHSHCCVPSLISCVMVGWLAAMWPRNIFDNSRMPEFKVQFASKQFEADCLT